MIYLKVFIFLIFIFLHSCKETSLSKPDTSNERKKQDFLNELIGRMTVEEKVGQLRLISIGPENPTEKVLKMIENSEVGAIFNTRTKNEIRKLQEKAVNSSSNKILDNFQINTNIFKL